jgi:hypothetical protein
MSSRHDSSGVALPPRLQARSAAFANLIDRNAVLLYGIFLAGFLFLFCAAARLLTLETDEAWILLSTAHAFGVRVPATGDLGSPTVTTGGPHLLIHGLIAFATMDVLVHRLVSIVAAAGLLWLVYRIFRATGSRPGLAAAGTASFAAAPGFLFQAGLATGEVIATALLVAATVHWIWRGSSSLPAAMVTGVMLGAAIAARVNLLAAGFALIAYVLLTRPQNVEMARRAIVAVGVGTIVAGACFIVYYKTGDAGDRSYLGVSTGLDGAKTFPEMLLSMEIANQYLPLLLVVGIIGAWLIGISKELGSEAARRSSELSGLLLLMGMAMLLAWILIAPLPHLRYVWPAIACIWLAGILLLLNHWSEAQRTTPRLALHGLAVSACVYSLVTGLNSLADGESISLAYQATGNSPRVVQPRGQSFRAAADQRSLAAFVASRPSASFYAFVPHVSYALVYLSGRKLEPLSSLSGGGERYLLISPADYRVWHPGPSFGAWARSYTHPAFSSGGFAALRIRDGAPPLATDYAKLGQNDLF